MNNKIYAGIGSRETPTKILCLMKIIGICLAGKEYTLHTGAAKGADQAFAEGAVSIDGKVNLFLPWASYEKNWWSKFNNVNIVVFSKQQNKEALNSVYQYHPNSNRLKSSVIALHARNYSIIKDVGSVICYTKNGAEIGGTGQGIRIAKALNKRIYNLGKTEDIQKILEIIFSQTKES